MSRLIDNRYELDSVVRRGSMAEVYRAHDIRLDRTVGVKTLRSDLAGDQTWQTRFRREAQSAASLRNRSTVAVYDTGQDMAKGLAIPYIVMEYVDGQSVRDLLEWDHALPPEQSWKIIDAVLDALDYSHRAGIIHRGIKPGNVMVTRNGDIKVKDFDVNHAAPTGLPAAQYLSPEQARSERVDTRSDLYSTGCLMYELLTGRPPFTGDSPVAIAYQHVREKPMPPSVVHPDIPPWADAIVLKAMAKDPADRYQSADEMRMDVLRARNGRYISRSALRPERSARSSSRYEGDSRPMSSSRRGPGGRGPGGRGSPSGDIVKRPNPSGITAPTRSSIAIKKPVIIRIAESSMRRSEPLGTDIRKFNNARSSSTATETITVQNESNISVSIDLTKTRGLSGNASIGFADLASARASLENELARRYSIQLDTKLTYSQETLINIPAYTHVEVIFHWYRVWVTGVLIIAEQTRRPVEIGEIPFEITTHLAFDKETRDVGTTGK